MFSRRSPRPPGPERARTRVRLRWLIWRLRFLIAAGCVAAAATVAVAQARPPQAATVRAVALNSDVGAGQALTRQHVHIVDVPGVLLPPGAFTATGEVLDRATAINLPEGTILTPGMLAGNDATAAAPRGTVVVPVRLSDPATADFLKTGDRVDLVLVPDPTSNFQNTTFPATPMDPDPAGSAAEPPTEPAPSTTNKTANTVVLAKRAFVLPHPQPAATNPTGLLPQPESGNNQTGLLLVAVTPKESHTLTAAARSGYIAAVLVE